VINASGGVSSIWNSGTRTYGADYLAFADGNLFVTSYYDSKIYKYNGVTGAFMASFSVNSGRVIGITAGPTSNISPQAVPALSPVLLIISASVIAALIRLNKGGV
jgi:hypothetical protein